MNLLAIGLGNEHLDGSLDVRLEVLGGGKVVDVEEVCPIEGIR